MLLKFSNSSSVGLEVAIRSRVCNNSRIKNFGAEDVRVSNMVPKKLTAFLLIKKVVVAERSTICEKLFREKRWTNEK